LPEALTRFQAGEELAFGTYRASQQGLTVCAQTSPRIFLWEELEIEVSSFPHIYISYGRPRLIGDELISRDEMPNIGVLWGVIEYQICEQARLKTQQELQIYP
jgi:hypothetical protein